MTESSPSPDEDRQTYQRLQSLLLTLNDLDTFLKDLAHLATTVVQHASAAPAGASAPEDPPTPLMSCGITLRYDGHLMTVGSSDARAEALDETQYDTGAGPCLEALESGQVTETPDLATETRWPEYVAAAVATGLRCSISFPLTVSDRTFGAMNSYGFDQPNMIGETERRQLELFAAQAAGTLWVATRHVKDTTLMAQMEMSLRSRTMIDQALGIIMAQQHCTASEAFTLIRRESQNGRRLLRDVAADLIIRTTGRPPEPGRRFDPS
jgi:hypothetical protein